MATGRRKEGGRRERMSEGLKGTRNNAGERMKKRKCVMGQRRLGGISCEIFAHKNNTYLAEHFANL